MQKINYLEEKKVLYSLLERNGNDKYPITIEIQPTNNCNYACSYCAYKKRKSQNNQLNFYVLENLIRDIELMGVKTVCISGGGEPTVYKYFDYLVGELYSRGVKISLLTNGVNQEKIIRDIDKFDYIVVHIASTNPKKYKRITKGDLENVINIANNIKEKNESVLVQAKLVIAEENMDNINQDIDKLLKYNFDNIICVPCYDYESKGNVAVNINKIQEEIFSKVQSPNVYFKYKNENDYANNCYMICKKMHALIFADGSISICPSNGVIGNGIIGNINDNSFMEVWNGYEHEHTIQCMNDVYKKHECRICRFMKYNMHIQEIYDLKKNPHVFYL